jgi:hypothetical protein
MWAKNNYSSKYDIHLKHDEAELVQTQKLT